MTAESYKLTHLQKLIGYDRSKDHKDHRALDDVLVTVRLWSFLRDILARNPATKGQANDVSFFNRICSMPKAAVHELLRGEEDGAQCSSVDDDTDEEGLDDATPPVEKKRHLTGTPSDDDPRSCTPSKVDRSGLSRSCRSRLSDATDISSFSKSSSSGDSCKADDDDPPQLVDLLCDNAEHAKPSTENNDDDSMQIQHLSAVGTTLLARTDLDTPFRVCTIVDEDGANAKVLWKAVGAEEQQHSWIPRRKELFSTALAEMRRQSANKAISNGDKQPVKAAKSLLKLTRVPTSLTASDVANCQTFLDRNRAISKASSLVALTNKLSHSSETQKQCAQLTVSGSVRLIRPNSSSAGIDDFDLNFVTNASDDNFSQDVTKLKMSSVAVFSGDASRRNKNILAAEHSTSTSASTSNNSSKTAKNKKAAATASMSILTYFQKTKLNVSPHLCT
jgi:hypothetical protein